MRAFIKTTLSAAAVAAILAVSGVAAQQPPPSGPRLTIADVHVRTEPPSKARGAPNPPVPNWIVGPDFKGIIAAPGPKAPGVEVFSARDGAVPKGISPLDHDVFSSTDFYADKALWMDKRYWRCGSAHAMQNSWGAEEAPHIGNAFPRTVAWGNCDNDYKRSDVVSPYPYKTAQAHYEALMSEAKSRGGPTVYDAKNPPPDWNGRYSAGAAGNGGFGQLQKTRSWIAGDILQMPTYLSLLTPEYQQKFVQDMYHYAHGRTIFPAAYCWPDGFLYRWFGSGAGSLLVTPQLVQFNGGINERIVIEALVGGTFKMNGAVPALTGTPQYWGDTIGFWDGDVFVMWTSNIKHWMSHGMFEYSDKLQAIEIFTPIDDRDGKFVGLQQETVLYDADALVDPVRIVFNLQRSGSYLETPARAWTQCTLPLVTGKDGNITSVSPGQKIEYTVPDLNGRPWADIWEQHFEKDMKHPQAVDVLQGF